ncbi:MAG: hypothetical protein WA317_16890, partial [Mycobacterium sp.]|uniref:hypothetical protein n=1 Tax=Mycobacterium sp. TaxID=1785 RepID=UPI003CC56F04
MVAMSGWHLHRHHRGPQFLIDTTNTEWGLLSGHQWRPPLGHQWGLFHGHGHELVGICEQKFSRDADGYLVVENVHLQLVKEAQKKGFGKALYD